MPGLYALYPKFKVSGFIFLYNTGTQVTHKSFDFDESAQEVVIRILPHMYI